jgi:hypothetical protein
LTLLGYEERLCRLSDRRFPPLLLHKREVTEGSRGAVSADLSGAILSSERKIVGLVLNAVDDRLSTAQQIADDWSLNRIRPLGPVLKLARDAGRVVILQALETAGGIMTPAAFSNSAEIPAARLDGLIAQIQRLLNVDGYEILSLSRAEKPHRIEYRQAQAAVRPGIIMDISPERRRDIIAALRKGTVPQRGLDFLAVGGVVFPIDELVG